MSFHQQQYGLYQEHMVVIAVHSMEMLTEHLASVCNGRQACEYIVDVRTLGDPAGGCGKDYVAEWRCGNSPERASVAASPEAGNGKRIVLRCPAR